MARNVKRPQGIEAARKLKLTLGNISVLKQLDGAELAQHELAKRLSVSKQSLAYNIQKLLRLGLIDKAEDFKYRRTAAGGRAVAGIV